MKKYNKFFSTVLALFLLLGCTSEFEEFKTDDKRLTGDDVSAAYFFTNTQTQLWGPSIWNNLFGPQGFSSAFSEQFAFSHKNHWEQPDIFYNADRGWSSDFVWDPMNGYFKSLDLFLKAVAPGADLENALMESTGQIMKASYFSLYTDMFGEVPFTEIGQAGVLTPRFDTQKEIYVGIIELLDQAMATIGDNTATGEFDADIASNDVVFFGDLQLWKMYANSLKLRVALRAKGAPGADFADAAITQALSNPLLTQSIILKKDYDVHHNISSGPSDLLSFFGVSPQRMTSIKFVNALQDNNDPRLPAYVDPIVGGEITFAEYSNPDNKERIDFILQTLDDANVVYSSTAAGSDLVINIEPNKYYSGMPGRTVDNMKTFLFMNLFSEAAEELEGEHTIGLELDKHIMPLAEVYFLQAEAAVLGFGGDANALFQAGIQASFDQWKVSDNGYLASSIAMLSGNKEDDLQQIGFQSWLALYNVDWQAWAVARDFNLVGITDDLPDLPNIYNGTNQLGLNFPQRMRYGTKAYALNGDNVTAANGSQGPDKMDTQLWFATGVK